MRRAKRSAFRAALDGDSQLHRGETRFQAAGDQVDAALTLDL